MRRVLTGLVAFLLATATLLVLPVYAAPLPEPEPVTTSTDVVELGSVAEPAPEAEVQAGTTDPVADVPPATPVLSVTRTGVAPFSLVGVTWAFDPAVTDTVVQVRVQDAAGAWGDWTEITAETADQGGAVATGAVLRGGTSPLWTGPSTGVEVELVTRSGAQPTDVALDLVDPGESEADSALGAAEATGTAHAATAMPPVYSRAQWGADERIRTWAPTFSTSLKAATLHHTADSNNYTADDVPAIMRSIYRYHTVSLGWGDIGYNVIVDKFGRLWEGRYGGLSTTVQGAHAGGFNTATFGVSMLGNFDLIPVPQVTVDAIAAFVAWKFSLHGIDPRGTVTLTSSGGGTAKYASGSKVTLPTLFGHRDVGSTVCPGQYGYARLGEIRTQVAARVGATASSIDGKYQSDPSLKTVLGAKVGTEQSSNGVTWQVYTGGRIYTSAATGAHVVRGLILDAYLAWGGPAVLGAPTTDHAPTPGRDGGYFIDFQGGSIYWTAATGAQVVRGSILTTWLETGGPTGPLGFPRTSDAPTPGGAGWSVTFEGGGVYWSAPTGAQVVRGGILATWLQTGGPAGPLGFPKTSDAPTPEGRGYVVEFLGGSIYWSAATGTQVVRGGILTTWLQTGGTAGPLGFPTTSDAPAAGGGYAVEFQGGRVYWSAATGTQVVRGGILATWLQTGGPGGPLGYPTTSDAPAAGGGFFVDFQGGSVYWSAATGTQVVRGGIKDTWLATGGPAGPLGYPTTSDAPAAGGGYAVAFQGGSIYWSAATGTQVVRGGILGTWLATGGAGGPLGYPTTSDAPTPEGRGYVVDFQGGSIVWSPATGTQVVRGGILATWRAAGGTSGSLGFPTSSDTAVAGGYTTSFEGGSVFWSAAGGTQVVRGAILDRWRGVGGAAGVLGFPVSSDARTPDGLGFVVHFERGSVYWGPVSAAKVVQGALAQAYAAAGGPSSVLGFPITDTYAVLGGLRNGFEYGSMRLTTSTGAVTLTH